ncbi:MAG: hypothetical protein ACXWLM_03995 [Myxococcales bacterium]
MKLLALLSLSAPFACVPNDSPVMDPGENCLGCHGGEGQTYVLRRRHAQPWTIAGTVFDAPDAGTGVEGAQVWVTDAKGFSFSLRTNLVGNFYSAEEIALPLSACIERNGKKTCQLSPVTSGACNLCHNLPELGAPQPPLVAP